METFSYLNIAVWYSLVSEPPAQSLQIPCGSCRNPPVSWSGSWRPDLRPEISPVALLLIRVCGRWTGGPGAGPWPSQLNRRDRYLQRINCPLGLCCLFMWLSWKVGTVLLLCSRWASTDPLLERWGFQAARRGNEIPRPRHHLPNTKGFGKWGCVSVWLSHQPSPKSTGWRQLDLDLVALFLHFSENEQWQLPQDCWGWNHLLLYCLFAQEGWRSWSLWKSITCQAPQLQIEVLSLWLLGSLEVLRSWEESLNHLLKWRKSDAYFLVMI